MNSIKKSLLYALSENYLIIVIQTATSMVLARLLTPDDIGKFSIAIAILASAHMLREFGVGTYIVRVKELTQQDLKAVFGITLLMAWSLAIVLYCSRQLIADFYHEPDLARIMSWMTLNFIIIPFSSTVFPLLKREMKFHLLFYIGLISTLASSVTSIYFAYYGHGFMSLVWGSLANIIISSLLVARFRPKQAFLFPSLKGSKHIFSFGGKASLAHIVSQVGANLNELVIGKMLGFSNVALFSKAETVINMFAHQFLGGIITVYHPAIAQQRRENKPLEGTIKLCSTYITIIAFPFYGFLALFSEEIILLMFGEQWLASAHVIKILTLAGCISSVSALSSSTLYMINISMVLKSEVLVLVFRSLVIVPAAMISLEMIAWAQVATAAVGFTVNFILLRQLVRVKFWPFICHTTIANGLLSVLVLIPVVYFKLYWAESINGQFLRLIIAGILLAFAWIAFIFITNQPLKNEIRKLFSKTH